MQSTIGDKAYDYLGIQALPPRRQGRDRRRLNQEQKISTEEPVVPDVTEQVTATVIMDPFSPLVEEFF